MRTKAKLLWGASLALLAVLGGAATWYVLKVPSTAAGPPTAVVTRRDLSATVTAVGTIHAMVGAEVRVGSRIPGRVEELAVKVGDRVKAGQMIARLEQDDLRAAVAKARGDLAA